MAHWFKGKKNQSLPVVQVIAPADFGAARAGILEFIRTGRYKLALDHAKDVHKATHTAESEELLIEAYVSRIQGLLNQNMAPEAKALMELVRERYPAAGARLDALGPRISAQTGALDDLLKVYDDSAREPERRTAIDLALRQNVTDLSVIARSEALPPAHPLRAAARALQEALVAVTTGAVTDEAIALAEVPRRSPLAPWKALVRAIALFYRHEDESCRHALAAIDPESAAARLVPAIRAMLGGGPPEQLSGAAASLVSRATNSTAALRSAIEALEAALGDVDEDLASLQKAIRTAMKECRQAMPDRARQLQNRIVVRSMMVGLEAKDIAPHLGGPMGEDAVFFRMLARGMEQVDAPPAIAGACRSWNVFLIEAARTGWFKPNGPETAAVYLHVADILVGLDGDELLEVKKLSREAPGDKEFPADPATLFETACALDPHSEAFSQWLKWAKGGRGPDAEKAAAAWHKAVPADIEPILYLMERSAARRSFHKALQYLSEAERIDSVNPAVRYARLPLMAQQALNQIKQRKRQVWQTIEEMEALPQAAQGDRPALLAALRFVVSQRDLDESSLAHRAAAAKTLGSPVAAALLIQLVADASKQAGFLFLDRPEKLDRDEKSRLPATVARLFALASGFSLRFRLSNDWMRETERQFAKSRGDLDPHQLVMLAEAGLNSGYDSLAYAVSTEGLNRAAAPVFLLIRARALPKAMGERRAACAAAAAELAREYRDMETVDRAVGLLREVYNAADFTITIDQARKVLAREKQASKFPRYPGEGPSYRDIMPSTLCPCPDCRRARGEYVPDIEEDFDDDFDEDDFAGDIEDGAVPPDISSALFNQFAREMEESKRRGETEEQFVSRMLNTMGVEGKKGKRR